MIKTSSIISESRVAIISGTETSSNPASIAAQAVGTTTIAVLNARVGDTVFVTPKALETGLVVSKAVVTSDGTITITLQNVLTATAVDGAASDYDYVILQVL